MERIYLLEDDDSIRKLVIYALGSQGYEAQGFDRPSDIVLLTNRNFAGLTQEELTALNPDAKSKVFGAGVRARVTNLRWMDKIRTWQELLFVVRDMGTCPM